MRSTRKIAAVISAVMIVAAVGIAGCGDDNNDSGSGSGGDKAAKIAYITYIYADYQQAEEEGLKKALADTGGSVKVFNANFDPQKLQQQCQDAVTSGRFNAIVLTPVTPPTGVPCVKAAKAAGIPVIAMELGTGPSPNKIEPQVDGVVGSVVSKQSDGANTIAKLVDEACDGKDPCNVITDTIPGDSFGEIILTAVKAIPGVKIIQKINTNYDPSQMQKIAPDTFAAHPDADVLMTLSDAQALAAIPAAKEAGLADKLRITAAGGSRLGAQAIEDGSLFATAGTWPFQYGEIAGKMATQAVNGKTVDPETVDANTIDTPLVVTKDTVSQFKPEWGATAG